jgi:hypothetical protein
MSDRRATCIAWVLGVLVLTPVGASADDTDTTTKVANRAPEPPADPELLEYLGSVDAEGQEWMDYLARTDIAQVVKAKKPSDPGEDADK